MVVTDCIIALVVASPFIAALIFCLILLIGRGLRGLYRWAAATSEPLGQGWQVQASSLYARSASRHPG
jgi:hypothetical protein